MCTLNALHWKMLCVELDGWLPLHPRTNRNRRIIQPLLQPEHALYRNLIVFRCIYNFGLYKVTKEVQAAPYKDASALQKEGCWLSSL